jgi:hypothetical protein
VLREHAADDVFVNIDAKGMRKEFAPELRQETAQ